MSNPAGHLAQLKYELADQCSLLENAPLCKVKVAPSEDEASLSFKILLGCVRDEKAPRKRNVWVHMYPAMSSGQSPEIQFHSHEENDSHHAKYESENIGAMLTACAPAFKLPGRWSRKKLIALAKYYFLEKLLEHGNEDDQERMRFGVPIGQAFKDELKFVCREFEEQKEWETTSTSTLRTVDSKQDSQESGCNTPFCYADRTTSREPHQHRTDYIHKQDDMKELSVHPSEQNSIDNSRPHVKIVTLLVDLEKTEDSLKEDMQALDNELFALETNLLAKREERRVKKEEQQRIQLQKKDMLEGMSWEAIFNLGKDVGSTRPYKRQKLA